MTNKYLLKIAENLNKEYSIPPAIEGAAGLGLMYGAPQRILGYHTVYHGTSSINAEHIRKEGLNPKHGGTGSAAFEGSGRYVDNSKGKVHVTKKPNVAFNFAMFNTIHKGGHPTILKARVSDKFYKNMKADPDMGNNKRTASTTRHSIDSKYISGSKDSVGRSAFLNKRRLGSYYSTPSGAGRGLTGIAMALGGSALVGDAVHRLSNNIKNSGK